MLVRSCFLITLLKGHKSLGSLCNVKSKSTVSQSVSQWVTRSPIELLWTAKNGLRGQNNLSNYDCLLITLIFFSNPVRVGQSKLIASECYGRGRCMELRQFCQHGQQHHPPSQLSLIISNLYQLWPTNINITFSCFSDCSHIMSAVRGGRLFQHILVGIQNRDPRDVCKN